jgi:glucose/arabinose dehydrogenase
MTQTRLPSRALALPLFMAALLSSIALSQCGGGNDGGLADTPPAAVAVQAVNAYPALEFADPVFFTHAPGDSQRVFVVTQAGVIYVFNNTGTAAAPQVFLDISARVTDDGGEQGLLGLAFDPGYAGNGYFYVNYNPTFDIGSDPRSTAISRFTVSADPDVADAGSEFPLLSFEQPFANHKGGWLDVGPDGKLYIATGDGGGGGDPNNNAQNLNSPLGKILRINTDGSIPADNPFAGQTDRRGEIWASGFRNPFRASFDRATGKLWAGDVGQGDWEEIDLVTRGDNYGWRKFEGKHIYNETDPDPGNAIDPVFEYDHGGERCSIIGGYVYRGSALTGFDGVYLYADFCSRELWGLTRDSGGVATSTLLGLIPGRPTSFGEDAAGEIYITSQDGNIYKLVPAAD